MKLTDIASINNGVFRLLQQAAQNNYIKSVKIKYLLSSILKSRQLNKEENIEQSTKLLPSELISNREDLLFIYEQIMTENPELLETCF